MTATVFHSPVVSYHGTMTNMHGLWCVVDNYGTRLKLRDIYGHTLRCRAANVTVVTLPTFTEKRAEALHALRTNPYASIDGRVRNWLSEHGLIECAERRDCYRLTDLGQTVDDAIRPFWHDGCPVTFAPTEVSSEGP